MPFVTSSFLLLVVRPGATSSVLPRFGHLQALTLIGSEKTEAIQELRLYMAQHVLPNSDAKHAKPVRRSWIQEALVPKAMQKTLITQAWASKRQATYFLYNTYV